MNILQRRWLFVATIVLGSFLLFMVQPMIARLALPRLGGAPNVWNSAMLVFQTLLLAGYGYAHGLILLPPRAQRIVHVALLALAALSLPIALADLAPAAPGWEVVWVPALILVSIGPVFLLLSAQAPLMQSWFLAGNRDADPYWLYAASNVGSLAGLLAYPLLMEPAFGLIGQARLWSAGFVFVIGLAAGCALATRGAGPDRMTRIRPTGPAPDIRRIGLWLALSAVPSGLMLSTTNYLTTDIFAMASVSPPIAPASVLTTAEKSKAPPAASWWISLEESDGRP